MANEPVIIEGDGADAGNNVSPKTVLIILACVVIVIVLVMFYFYKKGENTGKQQSAIVNSILPYDTTANQNPNISVPGASETQQDLSVIGTNINSDISGLNIWGHNEQPYEQALALSNTDFQALYNTYNQTYYPEGDGTLTTDLQSEFTAPFGTISTAWTSIQQSMLNRLASLQLK